MKLFIGNDVGNSEQKIIINGEFVSQPTALSKVSKIKNVDVVVSKNILDNIYDNIVTTIDSACCTSGTYYVGNRAINGGQGIHNMDIVEKKNLSDIYYVNTLSIISAYSVKKTLEERSVNLIDFEETVRVNVCMACSLPVNQYHKRDAVIVKDKFKGVHHVTVHLGQKRIHVEIIFDYIKVLPESVSIMFALNKIKDKNYESKKILHVSIGEGTTEFPVTQGLEFNEDFIFGSDNGVGHAIEVALEPFLNETGLRNYTRQKYSELIKTNHKFTQLAKEFLVEPLKVEAETILRHIKSEIQKSNAEIDLVIVHGGGSILMRDYLENKLKLFCKSLIIDVEFVDDESAVSLEAHGLYIFTQTDIFKSLYEKSKINI